MQEFINTLEHNKIYAVSMPCEPRLGKRGLYPNTGQKGSYDEIEGLINFLAYANGERDLLTICELIKKPMKKLIPIVKNLLSEKIIREVNENEVNCN